MCAWLRERTVDVAVATFMYKKLHQTQILSQSTWGLAACRNNNLGQLLRFSEDKPNMQEFSSFVAPQDYVPGDMHFDGQAILGSLVLFSVLFFSGFGRISGFNAWVDAWTLRRQEAKRREVMDKRVELEDQWKSDSKDDLPPT